jgi:transcriptional regulator with XRE-family HTH domain
MDNEKIAHIISTAIDGQFLTLREAATELGVSHQTVANWKSGAGAPSIQWLMNVAETHQDWRSEMAKECLVVIGKELIVAGR